MSNVPPNIPPGGGAPPPPYDPKEQRRFYREQQKAAWRAQREAWKTQRLAWREHYRNIYGPYAPSMVGPVLLILIGVVALLVVTGHLNSALFWRWYDRWWPLLLIGAGLLMLVEWVVDLRRKVPVRRRGGFVVLLVLLAILGICSSAWNRGWGVHFFGNGNGEFFSFFGIPEHNLDRPTLTKQIPANASIKIQNPRGDISVTAGDTPSIVLKAHEVAFAGSDADAKKIFDEEAPHIIVNGNSVLVSSEGNIKGRVNLSVTVPRTAHLTVNSGRGDVQVVGLASGLQLTARGDVSLSNLTGPVDVRFSSGRHDFSASQLQGDLTLNGDCNDLTLSQIKGKVTQNGDIMGDVHMENISGPVRLHTSVTDLQVAKLAGDISLDSDTLRVNDAKGQVKVVTHAKDIDLNQIYGDSYVEDRDGRVAVEPAGDYSVSVQNSRGDIEIALPPNASATVDGHTRNGDIITDYGLPVSGDVNKSVSGKIGSGKAKITLRTNNGDLHIKKGTGFAPSPPAMNPPAQLRAPNFPRAPHLESQKPLPAQPVTQ